MGTLRPRNTFGSALRPTVPEVYASQFRNLNLTIGEATGPTEVDLSGGVIVGSNVSGALRGTTDGTAAKDFATGTKTGLAYVWTGHPYTVTDGVGLKTWLDNLRIEMSFTEATANDIGVIAGFTSAVGFTLWTGTASVRTSAGNTQASFRDVTQATVTLAAAGAIKGGVSTVFNAAITGTNVYSFHHQYDAASPTTSPSQFTAKAHTDWATTTTIYPFVGFIGGTNAGYVEIAKVGILYHRTPHVAAV